MDDRGLINQKSNGKGHRSKGYTSAHSLTKVKLGQTKCKRFTLKCKSFETDNDSSFYTFRHICSKLYLSLTIR